MSTAVSVRVPNVVTVARFELVRLFFTRRGLVTLTGFTLIWLLVLRYPIFEAVRYIGNDGFAGFLAAVVGPTSFDHLLAWPVAELAVYWVIALYLMPLFCLVLTADQTASDRSRGTLRLLVLRATRDAVFFGRFGGQLAIQLILIALTLAMTIVLVWLRQPLLIAESWSLLAIIAVNLVLVLAPYTALMATVSVIAKSARQATTYAVILWIVALTAIGWVRGHWPDLAVLDWLLPGSQIQTLLTLSGWQTLSLAPIPLLQTAVLLAIGRTLMQKSSL